MKKILIVMILALSVSFNACAGKVNADINKTHAVKGASATQSGDRILNDHVKVVDGKFVQYNVITDPKAQMRLVKDILALNYQSSHYEYDSKRWGMADRWDNTAKAVEAKFQAFKDNNSISNEVAQDQTRSSHKVIYG